MTTRDTDALASTDECERRLTLLDRPHMAPLAAFVAALRVRHPERRVPDADPRDGGVAARVLLLLEAPGPQSVATGFISHDSPNGTARNLSALLDHAAIPREAVLIWNVVPWYVGDGRRIRPVTVRDIDEAFGALETLLGLLTSLERIVLVGRKAQRVEPRLRVLREDVTITRTWHPSPQVFNISPERRAETHEAFAELGRALGTHPRARPA